MSDNLSLIFCQNGFIKSSKVTAANEFKPPETVDNAPEKMPATKNPGKPGFLSARISITKRGRSWKVTKSAR